MKSCRVTRKKPLQKERAHDVTDPDLSDLKLELQREVDGSAPGSSSFNSGQEQSFPSLPRPERIATQLMPRIMNGDHRSVATAPLDLRTTNRERGSAGSRSPDCKGRAKDARGTHGSPARTDRDRSETHWPVVRSAPGPEHGAARKRPADKSSYRLPFRKRPIPVEPECGTQSPVLPESKARFFSPAVDADFTLRETFAGRLETHAGESRVAAAPATLRRAGEAGQSPDGYPARFLHPFDYGPYPVYCLAPVPELTHPLTHQAESLRTGVALATRQDEDGDTETCRPGMIHEVAMETLI
ncbi:hypothetical protein EYF80_000489 [Liparis tanakae]|uniref:Uncharacterized protein n=1 Tax=Liparis tanakae TaxID=230148 RepID=A0A4Z2JGW0_9TELE|nr:hypothetical protein EYF80_000489 [Liparis tanakae]